MWMRPKASSRHDHDLVPKELETCWNFRGDDWGSMTSETPEVSTCQHGWDLAPGSCRLVKATKPWYWGFSSILFCRNSTSRCLPRYRWKGQKISEVSRIAANFGMLKENLTRYLIYNHIYVINNNYDSNNSAEITMNIWSRMLLQWWMALNGAMFNPVWRPVALLQTLKRTNDKKDGSSAGSDVPKLRVTWSNRLENTVDTVNTVSPWSCVFLIHAKGTCNISCGKGSVTQVEWLCVLDPEILHIILEPCERAQGACFIHDGQSPSKRRLITQRSSWRWRGHGRRATTGWDQGTQVDQKSLLWLCG